MHSQFYLLLSFLVIVIVMLYSCECDATLHYLHHDPLTSHLITYHAPTFPYLSSSTSNYIITGNITSIQPKQCHDMEQNWNEQIVVIKDSGVVCCYLESLITRCRDGGCRGLIISAKYLPNVAGVFKYTDGTAYTSHGDGLTIPTVHMAWNDITRLLQHMSQATNNGRNLTITMTDGDFNTVAHTFSSSIWCTERIIQIIFASALFCLASFRLWQWYQQWRSIKEISHVAVVSLCLEWCACVLRAAAPHPMETLLGKYNFHMIVVLTSSHLTLTGIVDILIVCYFADVLHQSNGNGANYAGQSATFVQKYRGMFFLVCAFVVGYVSLICSLGLAFLLTPQDFLPFLFSVYFIVMGAVIIILCIMVRRVFKTLSSVMNHIQPSQQQFYQQNIRKITNRVIATVIGCTLSITPAILFIFDLITLDTDFLFHASYMFGAHLSCAAHIETFHARVRTRMTYTSRIHVAPIPHTHTRIHVWKDDRSRHVSRMKSYESTPHHPNVAASIRMKAESPSVMIDDDSRANCNDTDCKIPVLSSNQHVDGSTSTPTPSISITPIAMQTSVS